MIIGGPLDGQVLVMDDGLDYFDAQQPGTLTTFRYRRLQFRVPVGPKNASACFVPASLDQAEAVRLIEQALRTKQ